jgi:uncharacterized cofD-like protein
MKVLLIGDRERSSGIKKVLAGSAIFSEPACSLDAVRKKIRRKDIACAIFDSDAGVSCGLPTRAKILQLLRGSRKRYIFVTSDTGREIIREAKAMNASDIMFRPYSEREFIMRVNACCFAKTKISCIGGGTGLFNLLTAIKSMPGTLITSIVSMTDDGGSTGRLRETFGALPPGDVRMSLVALSGAPDLMNRVLQYRFKTGGECFAGHNIGNIVLVALSEISGSMKEGVKNLGDILNIQGIVTPVTATNAVLNAAFDDGTVVRGETNIDLGEGRSPDVHIKRLWHEPETDCSDEAYAAVLFSDAVILGPGDLYTSVITNLLVRGMKEAIAVTDARKIYMCNLMTKPGETAHFSACDHVEEIIKYLGGDHLDHVVVSDTVLSREALERYAEKGQVKIEAGDLRKMRKITRAAIVMADVGHETELIRHDSDKTRKVIEKILGAK